MLNTLLLRARGNEHHANGDRHLDHSHFSLAYREKMRSICNSCSAQIMKTVTVIAFLSMAACVGLLAYQHNRYSALYERQNQAIALVQKRHEASLRENQALKVAGQIESRSRTAFSQAQPIAARYQQVFKVKNRTTAR